MTDARLLKRAKEGTEAQFLRQIIKLAKLRGWRVHHQRPAMTRGGKWVSAIQGDAGFPDLVLVRDGSLVFAELKVGKNVLSPEQEAWKTELQDMESYFVWCPADWPEIEQVLE